MEPFFPTDIFYLIATTIKSAALIIVSSFHGLERFFYLLRFTLPTKRYYNHLISFVWTPGALRNGRVDHPLMNLHFLAPHYTRNPYLRISRAGSFFICFAASQISHQH